MSDAAAASGPDAHHSLLSRAHSATQAPLDAFWRTGPAHSRGPRPGHRRYVVEEMEARTALTVCRIPGEPWSLNPYTGCSHACAYCYVPSVAHLERRRWGSYVIVKRNLPTVLARELKRRQKRDVFLSSATDPYQPAEGAYRITRRCLELIVRAGWNVRVLTRNPLVLRDLDLLKRLPEVCVGMSVPTLDDDARRLIEPGAPSVPARLKALGALADAGLEPYVNLAPCYPLTGGVGPDDVAASLKDAGVACVHWAPWRYMEGVRPVLARHVAGTGLEPLVHAVEDPTHMDRLRSRLQAACRRAGIPFHRMDGAGRRAGTKRVP